MKQSILALIVVLFRVSAGYAQDTAVALAPLVENPPASAFRLPEDAFLSTYGFNDTARAVIQLYYRKWVAGKRIMYIAGTPASAVTAVGRHYDMGPYGVAPNYNSYTYDPWVAPVISTLLAGSAFGLIKATKWNRRQLYQTLRTYRATHQLPAAVVRALHAAPLP